MAVLHSFTYAALFREFVDLNKRVKFFAFHI